MKRIQQTIGLFVLLTVFMLSAPVKRGLTNSRIENPLYTTDVAVPQDNYIPNFSTYLGGSGFDHARDVYVDSQGFIYVVGGTNSVNFPTTIGPAFNNRNCQVVGGMGVMDVFILKLNPSGGMVWSRLMGGPCYDRAYAVEVDSQGYIYIAGRAGPGFPTTAGSFQPTFQGTDNGGYGYQNAFVAKIKPDGSAVEWASYVGVGQLARDLALDSNHDIYVPLGYNGPGGFPPAGWFANAFQKDVRGGIECGVVKITSDGTQVLWATWFGGSGYDSEAASIRVDSQQNVTFAFETRSNDLVTTPGAYDRSFSGGDDLFIAKLNSTGSNLLYGTYLGGSGDEFLSTHNLALDSAGNLYVSVPTSSTDFPTTAGAFQTSYGGGGFDMAVAKFSPTGSLLNSTYIGGNDNENPDGIYVDAGGNVFLTGETKSTNYPVTKNAYQRTNRGGSDAAVIKLSADFKQLLFSSYIGGASDDGGRSGFLGGDGSLYLVGYTSGSGWPTWNAFQNKFSGGAADAILMKLMPISWANYPYRLFIAMMKK